MPVNGASTEVVARYLWAVIESAVTIRADAKWPVE